MFSRRKFLQSAAVASLATPATAQPIKPSGQPNIVFITADEHRFDTVGCAGNAIVKTPNLDALAARGTLFSHTFCQGPLCQPSRASLITGQYVKTHHQSQNGFDMKPEWPTFLKRLQETGYYTAKVGKTHFFGSGPEYELPELSAMTPWCKKFGLDYLLEEFGHPEHVPRTVMTPYKHYLADKGLLDTYLAEVPPLFGPGADIREYYHGRTSKMQDDDQLTAFVANSAIDWLHGYKEDKPFFLWVSFIEPHPPLIDAAQWAALYENVSIPVGPRILPDTPNNPWGNYMRRYIASTKSAGITDEDALRMARFYYGLISQIDNRIGTVMKAVDEGGHERDTWFIYTSDHGEMLGDHNLVFKNVFYKGATRVPNIIAPPNGMTPRKIDALVESIDITATILDIAGTQMPQIKGRSLVPMMNGDGKGREAVHSELAGFQNQGNYFVMAQTQRYRFVYDTLNALPCELFDLKNDPGEMHNLITTGDDKAVMADLHKDYIEPFVAA